MKTRITTRVIIYDKDKLLLTRNNGQDFWYPGGGGLEENEDLVQCAIREVKEEIQTNIEVVDLMYVQEFFTDDKERFVELFFLAKLKNIDTNEVDQYNSKVQFKVVESKWISKADILSGKIKVFPEFIKDSFWKDIENFGIYKKYYKSFEKLGKK